eukprot:TRINITY_DN2881_c0_g1_i1.p1 TRINITY_DN2881_c0_g1~~TRINITY_DN2881_c0_g1_i1.p1  ORF type:complete len:1624 (-),score=446.89 TRINITY_DN2881_c0_g1_i1:45-4916(-)
MDTKLDNKMDPSAISFWKEQEKKVADPAPPSTLQPLVKRPSGSRIVLVSTEPVGDIVSTPTASTPPSIFVRSPQSPSPSPSYLDAALMHLSPSSPGSADNPLVSRATRTVSLGPMPKSRTLTPSPSPDRTTPNPKVAAFDFWKAKDHTLLHLPPIGATTTATSPTQAPAPSSSYIRSPSSEEIASIPQIKKGTSSALASHFQQLAQAQTVSPTAPSKTSSSGSIRPKPLARLGNVPASPTAQKLLDKKLVSTHRVHFDTPQSETAASNAPLDLSPAESPPPSFASPPQDIPGAEQSPVDTPASQEPTPDAPAPSEFPVSLLVSPSSSPSSESLVEGQSYKDALLRHSKSLSSLRKARSEFILPADLPGNIQPPSTPPAQPADDLSAPAPQERTRRRSGYSITLSLSSSWSSSASHSADTSRSPLPLLPFTNINQDHPNNQTESHSESFHLSSLLPPTVDSLIIHSPFTASPEALKSAVEQHAEGKHHRRRTSKDSRRQRKDREHREGEASSEGTHRHRHHERKHRDGRPSEDRPRDKDQARRKPKDEGQGLESPSSSDIPSDHSRPTSPISPTSPDTNVTASTPVEPEPVKLSTAPLIPRLPLSPSPPQEHPVDTQQEPERAPSPPGAYDTDDSTPGVMSPVLASPAALSPRKVGKVFGVDLEVLMGGGTVVPAFVSAAISRLAESEVTDIGQLYQNTEKLTEVKALKSLVDAGADIRAPETAPEIRHVAGLLKLFLIELPQPLISSVLYSHLMDVHNIDYAALYTASLQSLLWSLPSRNRVVLMTLVKFLRDKYMRSHHTEAARETSTHLAAMFGPLVMRINDANIYSSGGGSGYDEFYKIVEREVFRNILELYEVLFERLAFPDGSRYGVHESALALTVATEERILERMMDIYDPEGIAYLKMVLMTHPVFMKSSALLDYLLTLYSTYKTEPPRKWKQQRRDRIVDIVRMWVEMSLSDLKEHKKLLGKLIKEFPMMEQYVGGAGATGGNPGSGGLGSGGPALASKAHRKSRLVNPLSLVSGRSRSMSFTDGMSSFNILEHHPLELSHQFIVTDHDLFTMIKMSDWVRECFPEVSTKKKGRDHQTVANWLAHSQKYSHWAAGEIVKETNATKRSAIVGHVIAMAAICKNLNNYNIACGLLAGLSLPSVKRLDTTWQGVEPIAIEEYRTMMTWMRQHKEQRDSLDAGFSGPCVPFCFRVQSTLLELASLPTHIPSTTGQSADHPSDSLSTPGFALINVDKLRRVYRTVGTLLKLQQTPYSIKVSPRMYIYFQQMHPMTGDQLLALSVKHEAPPGPPPTATTSPLSPRDPAGKPFVPKLPAPDWKAEVLRVWNKPLEQLPIAIDLPRLTNTINISNNITSSVLFAPVATLQPSASFSDTSISAEAIPTLTLTPSLETLAAPPTTPTPAPAPALEDALLSPRTIALRTSVANKVEDVLSIIISLWTLLEDHVDAEEVTQKYTQHIPPEQDAASRDLTRDISLFLTEVAGRDSRLVRALKACNQAIIAPAVIELTLNVCAKLPFQDAGGWRMEVSLEEGDRVLIRHYKRQRNRMPGPEEEFEFRWQMTMSFPRDMERMVDVSLVISDLTFGRAMPTERRAEIRDTLAMYLSKDIREKAGEDTPVQT